MQSVCCLLNILWNMVFCFIFFPKVLSNFPFFLYLGGRVWYLWKGLSQSLAPPHTKKKSMQCFCFEFCLCIWHNNHITNGSWKCVVKKKKKKGEISIYRSTLLYGWIMLPENQSYIDWSSGLLSHCDLFILLLTNQ